MDSIKAQDIIRHIFKDEDKGVEYVTGLSITDGVEVLTKVLPELIKKAQEKNNVNDEGYFNEIGNVYRKIVVDKLLNADHLWTIYCDSTGYPYMVDDDIVVLYTYAASGVNVPIQVFFGYFAENARRLLCRREFCRPLTPPGAKNVELSAEARAEAAGGRHLANAAK